MSNPLFYPKVDEKILRTLLKLIESVPGYLDSPSCPYDEETRKLLRPKAPEVPAEQPKTSDLLESIETVDFKQMSNEELLTELAEIYNKLKRSGVEIGTANDKTDSTQKNAFFRISTSILEKIVEMRSQLTASIQISTFIDLVLNSMEDILDVDQRNEFMERMKRYREAK